jgi:hypothetical protein
MKITEHRKGLIDWFLCVVFHRADHNVLTQYGACRRCGRGWRIW